MKMLDDPIIEEVREVRRRHAEKSNQTEQQMPNTDGLIEAPYRMILILSNSLSKKWKVERVDVESIEEFNPAFVWHADLFTLGRAKTNILCVNEATLFSFILPWIRPMTKEKVIPFIIGRIWAILSSFGMPNEEFARNIDPPTFVKHVNRQVIGRMTDQKCQYQCYLLEEFARDFTPAEIEMGVNETPFILKNNTYTYPIKDMAEMMIALGHFKGPTEHLRRPR